VFHQRCYSSSSSSSSSSSTNISKDDPSNQIQTTQSSETTRSKKKDKWKNAPWLVRPKIPHVLIAGASVAGFSLG
jgi:hypothetical protein